MHKHRSSNQQWFGCNSCGYAWLGGTLPLNGKQYDAMFANNQHCSLCNRPAQFHGGFIRNITRITLFAGSASELVMALKNEVAA